MFVVVGTFDAQQGKPSSIGAQIISHLKCEGINGGNLGELDLDFSMFDVLLWMPNIDNAEDKIISRIKAKNRTLLLISSKRCVETKYNEGDVVGRLLKTRSNLGIMIERDNERYNFKLIDALGNIFCNTSDIEELCQSIRSRVDFLSGLTRLPSHWQGERREFSIGPHFIDIVHSYGDRFAGFINAVNINRFLGNAATRCSFGFPAQRTEDGRVFVSRRNVDKQGMTDEDFVEVRMGHGHDGVLYWGDRKPSVDAPVQLRLFKHYRNVNYMIHGHVYVKNAPITVNKIPCGALEEFDEIVALSPDVWSTNFAVNLRGHGCLVLAGELSFLESIELQGRPFPED